MPRPPEGAIERFDAEWQAVLGSIAAARSSDAERPATASLGVTVLTGFLGSGKTTLLRRLISEATFIKIAVIVNDVGALNVDDALVASVTDERVELSNGCACCALVDDLAHTLSEVVEAGGYDAVVVEGTGVADAVALAQTAVGVPGCRLDGVVAMVDGQDFPRQLNDPRLVHLLRRQLEAAHLVVLSRADLLTDAETAALVAQVADVAPGRMVIPAALGKVDPQLVLGAAVRGPSFAPPAAGHQLDVVTDVVGLDGWSVTDVGRWCEEAAPFVARAKGWFRSDDGTVMEVQSVAGRWVVEPADRHLGERGVVVIGLDADAVSQAVRLADQGRSNGRLGTS